MHQQRCKKWLRSIYWRRYITIRKKMKRNITPTNQRRLDHLAIMLKEMRFAEGKNQDGFGHAGITRRQIQRAEYGNNMTLLALFSLLDCYGYKLKDLEYVE
jgi:hypothetical protein